ncbi:Agamous-like MADS-box protein AGL104-like protein [Drosera capensis]
MIYPEWIEEDGSALLHLRQPSHGGFRGLSGQDGKVAAALTGTAGYPFVLSMKAVETLALFVFSEEKKIEKMVKRLGMKLIEDELSRQLSFAKRRNGLMKKSLELAVLCDSDVIFLAFSSSGRLSYFSGDKRIEDVLSRFLDLPDSVREFPIPAKEQLQVVINRLKRQTEHHLRGDREFLNIKHEISCLKRDIAKCEAELRNWDLAPELITSVEEEESREALLEQTLAIIRERMAELAQADGSDPHIRFVDTVTNARDQSIEVPNEAIAADEVHASQGCAIPLSIPNPALAAGSSRQLSREPVPTSCTNLLPGEPPVQDGVLPDPGVYQACSCSPHDLLAAQKMLPSFFPTPVSSTGECSGFWSIMDPEWIEEDSTMQMLLSQLRNECIDLCDAYGYSHGGYRSMLGQDAVFPETAGRSPYPGMQAQGGRGQPGQMPFGRHFEVGESSKSRPKRKRQDEANTEWMPPPQRAQLDRSQGILGGHRYHVYDAVFQGMNLPADPYLRGYMYYIGRGEDPDFLLPTSLMSILLKFASYCERQSTNDIMSLGLLTVNLGIHPYSSPAPFAACRSSFVY